MVAGCPAGKSIFLEPLLTRVLPTEEQALSLDVSRMANLPAG
jgi:hypothetical protein